MDGPLAVKKPMTRTAARTIGVCVCAGGLALGVWFELHHPLIDLWLTPDQQGRYYFEKLDYGTAAQRFRSPLWKGISYYRSGDFDAAVAQFAMVETAEGYFNLGNAYAHLGKLEQAAASFEAALRREPHDMEARENLELVRLLLRAQAAKKQEESPEGDEPTFDPDAIKVDEKGKKGKVGEVGQKSLSDEQIQELWMRRLQATPSDFLRLKFAIQAQGGEPSGSRGASGGGR